MNWWDRVRKESKEGSEKGVGIGNIPTCLGLIVYMNSLELAFLLSLVIESVELPHMYPSSHQMISVKTG